MMDEAKRLLVEDALTWSGRIGCCSDKERYAFRVWDLLDELGIRFRDVPEEVVLALKELMNWEDCTEPCQTVDAFLRSILDGGTASDDG